MAQPSAQEQYLLELINRFRANPAAEYDLLVNSEDSDVNRAIAFFGVDLGVLSNQWSTLSSAQPLAWSNQLGSSADTHSQLMIDFDQQSHNLPGEPSLLNRINGAGSNSYSVVAENIFAYSNSPFYAHAGFAIDWGDDDGNANNGYGTGIQNPAGHRVTLLNDTYREVGLGIIEEDNPNTKVGSEVVTQHFGFRSTGTDEWLLGVAFHDLNDDDLYSVGEGLNAVTVDIESTDTEGGFSTSVQTGLAGGYQALVPQGEYTVSFSRNGSPLQTTSSTVIVTNDNVKQDLQLDVGVAPSAGLGKIVGIQFDDADGDRIQDVGESGIADRTVFIDSNGNRQLDSGETTTQTDADGIYIFNNLTPGTYSVLPVVSSNRAQTSPSPNAPIGSETYQIDDGADNGWGGFVGDALVFNQFETVPGQETLTSISVALSKRGNPTKLFIYQDADGDDTPEGNELLLSVTPTFTGTSGFANVAIDPTVVSGTFFVGASYAAGSPYTWVLRDTDSVDGKSWSATSSDPTNFLASKYASSDWLLRANAAGTLPQVVTVEADKTVSGANFGDRRTSIVGTSSDDTLNGTIDDDTIVGLAGNDTLFGLGGSDTLIGDDDNDTLVGADANDVTPGLNEIDVLSGGAGNDLFVLGDTNWRAYDDSDTATAGNTDYANVTDFDPAKDVVQLQGSAADYRLEEVSGSETALYLIKPGNEPDELIARFAGNTGLDLNASYFSYKSPTLGNIGEVGQINNLSLVEQTITLARSYTNPVVIVQPASSQDADPVAVRLKNIGGNQFTVALQEPVNLTDGLHSGETLTYMVLEAGTWYLEDGTKIEVGTFNQSDLIFQNNFTTVGFTQDFVDAPVILSQVQTTNETDFVRTRQRDANKNGVQIGMEEQQSSNSSGHASETIGYFAIESSTGSWNGIAYEAGKTGDNVTSAWKTVNFDDPLLQPQLLASVSTYDGPDPAGIRYRNLTNNSVQLRLEEDTTVDAETNHTTENVDFLALGGTGFLTGEAANITVAPEIMAVTGKIQALNQNVLTINYGDIDGDGTVDVQFENPVVIVNPPSFNGAGAATPRVFNVTGNSFDVKLQEPDFLDIDKGGGVNPGTHVNETVHYMVIESGTWDLEDGSRLTADTIQTNRVVENGFEQVIFDTTFSEIPAVISQVQTNNDPSFVFTRQKRLSASSFKIALQEEQRNINTGHASETVGYVAFDPIAATGTGSWSGHDYLMGRAGQRFDHSIDANNTLSFGNAFDIAPNLFAQIDTFAGPDSASLRYENLGANSVQLRSHEDKTLDSEIGHAAENISYFAIEGSGELSATRFI